MVLEKLGDHVLRERHRAKGGGFAGHDELLFDSGGRERPPHPDAGRERLRERPEVDDALAHPRTQRGCARASSTSGRSRRRSRPASGWGGRSRPPESKRSSSWPAKPPPFARWRSRSTWSPSFSNTIRGNSRSRCSASYIAPAATHASKPSKVLFRRARHGRVRPVGSMCGSRCPRASTRKPCCRERSKAASPTSPGWVSTPTARASET